MFVRDNQGDMLDGTVGVCSASHTEDIDMYGGNIDNAINAAVSTDIKCTHTITHTHICIRIYKHTVHVVYINI